MSEECARQTVARFFSLRRCPRSDDRQSRQGPGPPDIAPKIRRAHSEVPNVREESTTDRRMAKQHKEAVDAVGPVDAKNAPTGPWKTEDGFPQASTAIIGYEESLRTNDRQPQRGARFRYHRGAKFR